MKTKYLDIAGIKLHDQLDAIIADIKNSCTTGIDAHTVELNIHQSLRDIGFDLLEMFFKLCGDGDQGTEVNISENHTAQRLNELHTRIYQSIYGNHEIERVVYGSREGQKIECVPLDARLNLPEAKFSYLLQDWDQSLIVDSPYAKVSATIEKILGLKQSIHSMERINQKMSTSVGGFCKSGLPTPPQEKEKEIFVCSADGKGVPIRNINKTVGSSNKIVNENPLDTPGKNKKIGGKKMALVGATYTIDPYIRTPEEIVEALFREKDKEEDHSLRPKPAFKHLRASLLRDQFDTSESSYREVFNWIADEEEKRNPEGKKKIVCIMDGQDSLWKAINKYIPDKDVVEILDLLHVSGYIWEAAHIFYKKKSNAAVSFAKTRILSILNGEVASVIHGLKWKGTNENISDKKQERLDSICGYLKNNSHRVKYNEYLAKGYPIASGVIEGACRYVVKDRMERTGMRWILQGAHSMLGLRCIHLSCYWEEFMDYRIKVECERLYPWRPRICANNDIYDMKKAA